MTFAVLIFPYFFNIITSFPLSMLRPVGVLLMFHTFLQGLRLVVQTAVDENIEETNMKRNWVHWQEYLSLQHHQIMLSVQEEMFFPHQTGKYQYCLMTHQVSLLILLGSLWIHLHQAILISLVHHPINLYNLPDVQSHHALPCCIIFWRDDYIQTPQYS